jgi:hypothetical protein
MQKISFLFLLTLFGGCDPGAVEGNKAAVDNHVATSGKTPVAVADVPAEVLAAATAAQPGFLPGEAESETRDGRRYFDVGGKLADGSEIEFDMMEEGGAWRVVEMQRDIAFTVVPEPVRSAFANAKAGFEPARVIESRQGDDDLVIYEVFGPAANGAGPPKVEVKWDGARAELLTKEWAH